MMDAVKIKFKLPKGQQKLLVIPMFVYVSTGDELTVRKSMGNQMKAVYKRFIDTSSDVVLAGKCKNTYWQLQRAGSLKIEFAPEQAAVDTDISEVAVNRSMASAPEKTRRKTRKNGIS